MVEIELGKLLGGESHIFRFSRPEFHFLGKFDLFDLALERSFHRMVGRVLQQRRDREVSFVIGRRIDLRNHSGIAQSHRAAGGDVHIAEQAHVLVRRRGIPVHESDGQVGFGGGENLHRQHVRLSQSARRR